MVLPIDFRTFILSSWQLLYIYCLASILGPPFCLPLLLHSQFNDSIIELKLYPENCYNCLHIILFKLELKIVKFQNEVSKCISTCHSLLSCGHRLSKLSILASIPQFFLKYKHYKIHSIKDHLKETNK